jgi:hypothetical protein
MGLFESRPMRPPPRHRPVSRPAPRRAPVAPAPLPRQKRLPPPDPQNNAIPWLRQQSDLGISIEEWGPIMWNYLHLRAINWSKQATPYEVLHEHQYLRSVFENLPCPECRQHALDYYWSVREPDLRTAATYQYWMFVFHDRVNQRLGKSHRPDYSEYSDMYRAALVRNALC